NDAIPSIPSHPPKEPSYPSTHPIFHHAIKLHVSGSKVQLGRGATEGRGKVKS
ncbi:hypothetical protein BT96DRAFT_916947, partial [Gymnopus androsaceus JB14]